jgi:hypothetical protein
MPKLSGEIQMSKFAALSGAAILWIAASLTTPASAEETLTHGRTSQVAVKPFDVFVDPPSRFVFLKLPAGWKFVGSLSEAEMRTLPPSVLTSLLPIESERQVQR